MTDMDAFDRLVASEVVRGAAQARPVDDLTIFEAAAKPRRWGLTSIFAGARLGLAAVVVAVFGGILLIGLMARAPSQAPAIMGASPSVPATAGPTTADASVIDDDFSLPPTLPDDIEHGTIETPAGPARWLRLDLAGDSFPGSGDVLPWPGGIAVFQAPRYDYEARQVNRPAQLWATLDGLEWQAIALPIGATASDVRLSVADGTYWLMSGGEPDLPRHRIWTSADGIDWQEIDTGEIPRIGPAGLDYSTDFSAPVTRDGRTLVAANDLAWLPLFITRPLWESDEDCAGSQLFTIDGDIGLICQRPTWHFEDSEDGLRVFDFATGSELTVIGDLDLGALTRVAGGVMPHDGPTAWSSGLLVIEDGRATRAPAPWRGEMNHGEVPALVANADHYFGFDDTQVLRSSDGSLWADVSTPDVLELAGGVHDRVAGLVVAGDDTTEWASDTSSWTTEAGFMWELVPADPPVCDTSECRARGQEQASVTRLGSGWFASDPSWGGSHDGDTLWMHAGGEWVSLAELGMERPADPDGAVVHKSGIGNTTMFWSPGDEPNPGSLWILDLEPRG